MAPMITPAAVMLPLLLCCQLLILAAEDAVASAADAASGRSNTYHVMIRNAGRMKWATACVLPY